MNTHLGLSRELSAVVARATDVAGRTATPLSTAHLLLAFFMVPNRASKLLRDHAVTVNALTERLSTPPLEERHVWDQVFERAHQLAVDTSAVHIGSVHVLWALCLRRGSAAYRLISDLRLDMGAFRVDAIASVLESPSARRPDSVSGEFPPVRTDSGASVAVLAPPVAQPSARPPAASAAQPPGRSPMVAAGTPPERGPQTPATRPPVAREAEPRPSTPEETLHDLRTRHRSRKPAPQRPPVKMTPPQGLPLPPSVRSRQTGATGATAPPAKTAPPVAYQPLDPRDFPVLTRLGRNLTEAALRGELDRVIGRDAEIDQLVDILNKRRTNNPVLIGEAGVGKTAVVEGLAQRMAGVSGTPPPGLAGKVLIEIESSKMVAGTGIRGSFAERLMDLKREVAAAEGRVVVFLDEIHQWIGMGAGGDGNADGAGELKTALSRGEFPCVGATTHAEYTKHIESDPAFARRFQKVRIEEPSEAQASEIIRGVIDIYARHHEVRFADDAVDAAVGLTHRYIPDRRLPEKAVNVLDTAAARARRASEPVVTREGIARVVAEVSGLSADKLLMNDHERFAAIDTQLRAHVVGHAEVVDRVANTLRRNYAGFMSGRPIGTFLFLGPTGVGKTEFAKAIARVLFESEGTMTRLDMSEFMEAHTVARLIGSPPGYVGHGEGGQLTEAVRRRPYQLVLFDEVEKAHPDVLNILIQLLDEGRLTDSRGRTVDFSNTVVVMTSNLGAEEVTGTTRTRRVGFGASPGGDAPAADGQSRVLESARGHFRPELWNRIQERLVFMPLGRDEIAAIARMQLDASSSRLHAERRIRYRFDDEVVAFLIENGGYDPEMGARPMRRAIERWVETPIADLILTGRARRGDELVALVADGVIVVEARPAA